MSERGAICPLRHSLSGWLCVPKTRQSATDYELVGEESGHFKDSADLLIRLIVKPPRALISFQAPS